MRFILLLYLMTDKKNIIIFILSLVGALLVWGIIGFGIRGCGMRAFDDIPNNMPHGRMMRTMDQTGTMMMRHTLDNQPSQEAISDQSIPNTTLPKSSSQEQQNPLQEPTK